MPSRYLALTFVLLICGLQSYRQSFVLGMVTLAATGMTNRYLRVSHFIGGLAMLEIGDLLIFAPDWLTITV